MEQLHGMDVSQTAWTWSRPAAKILVGARAEPP